MWINKIGKYEKVGFGMTKGRDCQIGVIIVENYRR
jgi:hypothetical protein